MRRVMIIGQPGSGKSTLALAMGRRTGLPVYHMDHFHWMTGWVERPLRDKNILCSEVHENTDWIFEGGHSATWDERLARADTLIWLDVPPVLRMVRICRRTLRHWGRNRPDMADGCPEHFNWAFLQFIWRTRHSHRSMMARLFEGAPQDKTRIRLTSLREVRDYLSTLGQDIAPGRQGRPRATGRYSAGQGV